MKVGDRVSQRTFKGSNDGTGLRVGIVVSRFNSIVTERLLKGSLKALMEAKVASEHVDIAHVPGAFEIPLVAEALAATKRYDAVICLGAIVRGETMHHEYLGKAIFNTLQEMQVRYRLPIAVGILTTENMEQALARAADDVGNKGYESAMTAIECATLLRSV